MAATHRGRLLAERTDGWVETGRFPVSGSLTGRYTPLVAF
ncbi:MAG: hypothetical protein J07HX64_00028 [halophilic archaeon J07HX64]|nr:MAG: hypothetical protein J07HX64_00028 [halophilic archaeon J07HX64]